jgi:hypothetical protein
VEAVLEIDEGPFFPDLLPQMLVGNDVAGIRQQDQKNLKRLTGKPDPHAVLVELLRWNIDLKGSEGQPAGSLRRRQHGCDFLADADEID